MTLPIRALLAIFPLAAVVGCGSAPPPDPWYPRALGPSAVPTNDGEKAVLARLGEIPEDGEIRSGELTAYVEAPYHAASDRRCRRVRFASGGHAQSVRTACESADGWQLAADVFGSGEPR
jgi:hypothetical protein